MNEARVLGPVETVVVMLAVTILDRLGLLHRAEGR